MCTTRTFDLRRRKPLAELTQQPGSTATTRPRSRWSAVKRDQSVGFELGQSDVLRLKRFRPAELVSDLPCGVLKEVVVVFVQPDSHPARVEEASFGVLLGHLTATYCLIEEREHLRAKKRRGQHMMPVGNHGLFAS
jgi:hypothetical protein